MAIKKIEKGPFNVTVSADDIVYLTVTIGDEQIGGNVVQIDGVKFAKGEIKNLNLGNGNSLVPKTLTVISNVLDVNPDSNKTSVTHTFENGNPSVFDFPQDGDDEGVDEDGDTYSLTSKYNFTTI